MKLLLDVLNKKNINQTPIWLMRQAGRYLPEYKIVRKNIGSFLDLCYSSENASKVTLQPIDRFGFDAAIMFSDILVIPDILGLKVEFLEGEGPKVETLKNEIDLEKLSVKNNSHHMDAICQTLKLTKEKLSDDKTLIGFAGSPWTVLTYILSEKKHDFDYCRQFVYDNYELTSKIIDILIDQTIIYLKKQIDSGAEVIQLFESWSSTLCEDEFTEFVIKPNKKIAEEIKKYNANIKIIGFPKGAGILYKKYQENIPVDGISIDQFVPMELAKDLQRNIVVQGNLDPVVLLTNKDLISKKVKNIMDSLSGDKFIFNLGHGIIKTTPIENVEHLVKYVKSY